MLQWYARSFSTVEIKTIRFTRFPPRTLYCDARHEMANRIDRGFHIHPVSWAKRQVSRKLQPQDAEALAQRLKQWGGLLSRLYVYFNNDQGGHAIENARTLKRLCGVSETKQPLSSAA
jgi:uncharacterized protein YecE (DUF72 family)